MKRSPDGGSGGGESAGTSRWDLFLLLLLGGHLIWIFSHFLPITVGPDAGGLFVQARLMATELSTGFRPESPMQFLGTHWMQTLDGDFHSRYPPGFPLVLAVAYALGGPRAPFFLNPILATCVVGLTYLVGRRWIGKGMAFWAAFLVATLPILNRLALHGDAHVIATAVLLLGVWLLLRWEDKPSWLGAFLAGLAFGILPTVRYPEAVVGLGVITFFALQSRPGRWSRGFLPAAVGASLPILLLGLHNARVYGAPWRTGYGFTNEQSAFSSSHLAANLPTYLEALTTGGVGLFFLLGSVGMVWMCIRAESRPRGTLFLGAVASLALLYSAYYWGAQEEAELTLRYFLATLPLLVLGTLWLVQQIPYRRVSLGLFSVLTLLYLGQALPEGSRSLLEEWVGTARGQAVTVAVMERVPPGSVLIARREIQDMLDYFGRWRLVDDRMIPGTPGRLDATLVWELTDEDRSDLSGVATPVQISKAVESRARYVGLDDQGLISLVLKDLRDWAGPDTGIFWLGKSRTVEAFGQLAADEVQLLLLGEVSLPGWGGGTVLPPWVPKAPLFLFQLELGASTPLS
jgi:hypothetical protein